jgi:hypothetical protein
MPPQHRGLLAPRRHRAVRAGEHRDGGGAQPLVRMLERSPETTEERPPCLDRLERELVHQRRDLRRIELGCAEKLPEKEIVHRSTFGRSAPFVFVDPR